MTHRPQENERGRTRHNRIMRTGSPAPPRAGPAKKKSASGKASKASAAAKDGGSAFRVAVRCRPLLKHERQQDSVLSLTPGAVTITSDADDAARDSSPRRERHAPLESSKQTLKSFAFDHVYDEFVTQEEVYTQFVAPFTAQFLAGYNVTLFAYGQTGTGKTFTVIGGDGYDQRGVVPRFVEDVFAFVASEKHKEEEAVAAGTAPPSARTLTEAEAAEARPLLVESRIDSVGVTVLEVYAGVVHDLLRPAVLPYEKDKGEKEYGAVLSLELDLAMSQRSGSETRCYWVRGGERPVKNTREALEALRDSMRLRHTASHALNEASSRSHCIFSLQLHRKREVYKLQQTSKGVWSYVLQPSKTSTSTTRANLVDLAGSEDARETHTSGSTLREAADINKSLFTLRKAIEHLALRKHTKSVFQEETLTKMLASSLLGQAYSLMIATIAPSAAALRHTRNTLQYAGTAASISLAAPKAAADDLSLRNAELEKKNSELLRELEQRGKAFSELEEKLRELEKQGGGGGGMGVGGLGGLGGGGGGGGGGVGRKGWRRERDVPFGRGRRGGRRPARGGAHCAASPAHRAAAGRGG